MTRPGAFMVVDRETVLGSLRATGSWDPDVLQDLRARLLSPARGAKRLGLVLVVIGAGGVLSLTLVPVAILLVVAGWWLRRQGQRSEVVVEQVFREFVRGTGQRPALARRFLIRGDPPCTRHHWE